MNQTLSMEKLFEMYGRLALERDLTVAENVKLKQQLAAQAAKHENIEKPVEDGKQ